MSKEWFSNLSIHQNYLEGFLKHKLLGPTFRVSNSVGLGWAPRISELMLLILVTPFENDYSK